MINMRILERRAQIIPVANPNSEGWLQVVHFNILCEFEHMWFAMNASFVASCDQIKLLFRPGPEWAWPNKTYIWSWQPLQFLPKSHLGRDLRTPLPAQEDAFAGTCSTSEPDQIKLIFGLDHDQIKLIFGLGNHCNSWLNHTRTPMAAAKPL